MKPWSLQSRLIALVLLPTALLVLGLGIWVVLTRFDDLEAVQYERGHLLLEKYRRAYEQIGTPDPAALQALAAAALNEPGLRSASLLDSSGDSLLHSGPTPRDLGAGQALRLDDREARHYVTRQDSWLFVRPLATRLPLAGKAPQPVWLMLEFSTSELTIRKYEALFLVSALCLLAMGAMALLLARLVRRWLAPVADMTDTLKQVDSEHLERRLFTDASGDLLDLEAEINALLGRLAADTEELKSSMIQTNEDLRETMEAMEVQNIELTLARKEAVEGNRIKSEFLANISHEIRTPLNGIMGFAKLLQKTQLSPRQLDYIKTIQKSADNLLAIINDVLDLSKIEAGKLVLDHIPLDVEEVIFEVMGMLSPLAEEKDLEQVAFIYDDVPRHLMGDPLRLKQILTNLVNNAIKFTPQGEITVRCMLESQNERQAVLRVSVTDTGIGLSESARADLFRAFSQGDPSTTRRFGGTGLGLVISKHLVEQMQGEINFESAEGKGSTFWFTFRAEIDSYSHSGHVGEQLHHRRILVAEPQPVTRQFLLNTLEHWGAKSSSAASLDELHAVLRDGPSPEALVVNLALLGSRGAMSSMQLDELRRQVNGPILLLSRSSDASQEQANYQDNQVGVMSKPVPPRELYSRLVAMFGTLSLQPAQLALLPTRKTPTLRVLAVDDNPANLKLVCTLLADLQVEAVPATDGYQAIRLCKESTFDLVFMDIQMPGLSGLEATQAIREHEVAVGTRKRLPIVALTAHAMANEREALLKSGMDDYLTKPVQDTQLAHMLAKWTGIDPRGQGAPAPAPMADEPFLPAVGGSVVNWQEGLKLAAGKADLARDMLTMLFNSLEEEKRKIASACQADDLDSLLGHVHYLHGATRYCGVPGLRSAAQVLETDIKSMLAPPSAARKSRCCCAASTNSSPGARTTASRPEAGRGKRARCLRTGRHPPCLSCPRAPAHIPVRLCLRRSYRCHCGQCHPRATWHSRDITAPPSRSTRDECQPGPRLRPQHAEPFRAEPVARPSRHAQVFREAALCRYPHRLPAGRRRGTPVRQEQRQARPEAAPSCRRQGRVRSQPERRTADDARHPAALCQGSAAAGRRWRRQRGAVPGGGACRGA
ncbi:MAG: chemotaxis protein CheY [Moraxellaceae bacterium]|nr:chemotaxis protein CheY [Moraxellaceae bacterium]